MIARRKMMHLALGAAAVGFSAFAQPAFAQGEKGTSTWDQIMQTKKLRLGAAPAEPWYFKDTSNSNAPGAVKSGDTVWRGVAPSLGKAIADAMGVQLEIVETTWGNAVAGLQANQYDVMFILDATPERALALDFVGPLLWYPVALLVKPDVKGATWKELNNPKYKLGGTTGSTMTAALERHAPLATIVRFPQTGDLMAAFQAGRIDGAVTTAPTADITRERIKMGKTVVPKPVVAFPGGGGLRKEADHRWRDYLQTVITYYYHTGKTGQFYDEFITFRGLDPKTVIPIVREQW